MIPETIPVVNFFYKKKEKYYLSSQPLLFLDGGNEKILGMRGNKQFQYDLYESSWVTRKKNEFFKN